ncbi:hypothetical protein CCR75_007291 [Bremia lactucae]|uniref:Uncharacterized protein n=1 Tax=Bremia lactucae TaxID=4779 RepID=A0A976IGV2_BRELC|nr:hypothetical protein CCR75_007291 [Bremia lactucae]
MTSVLDVEQRSREMLVLWIAFCLVHQQCVDEEPLCANYNIANRMARPQGGSSSRCSSHFSTSACCPVHSLLERKKREETHFFTCQTKIQHSNLDEIKLWNSHLKTQWNRIEQKKRIAAELRANIAQLEKNMSREQRELAYVIERCEKLEESYESSNSRQIFNEITVVNRLKRRLKQEIWQTNNTINQKKEALRRTLVLMIYSTAPAETTAEVLAFPNLSSTTWRQFYAQYTTGRALIATSRIFTASPAPFSRPSVLGPTSVDDLVNLTQYSSQCNVIKSFTEEISREFCHYQWMNAWPGEVDTLSEVLPARLEKLYSHWYWLEQNCILFRPREAECRNVFFIATFDMNASLHCFKVPFSDMQRPYMEILQLCDSYDQFVAKSESNIFKTLTRFEETPFVHALKSSTGVLKIKLPRFKLTFTLNESCNLNQWSIKGIHLRQHNSLTIFAKI